MVRCRRRTKPPGWCMQRHTCVAWSGGLLIKLPPQHGCRMCCGRPACRPGEPSHACRWRVPLAAASLDTAPRFRAAHGSGCCYTRMAFGNPTGSSRLLLAQLLWSGNLMMGPAARACLGEGKLAWRGRARAQGRRGMQRRCPLADCLTMIYSKAPGGLSSAAEAYSGRHKRRSGLARRQRWTTSGRAGGVVPTSP